MKQQHQWFCDQVKRHKVALYRLARSILRSDEDAKDAVAEAVCRAFAHLDSLWPLVLSLPDTLRGPISLYYYDGFSVREIGEILGLTEGAVKTRLNRGRQALKTILEKEGAV